MQKEIPQPQNTKPEIMHPELKKSDIENSLDALGLNYQIEGDDTEFEITISTPDEHRKEKEALLRRSVLNSPHSTEFDKTKLTPIVKSIQNSTNLDCRMETNTEKGIYTILVFETKAPKEFRDLVR